VLVHLPTGEGCCRRVHGGCRPRLLAPLGEDAAAMPRPPLGEEPPSCYQLGGKEPPMIAASHRPDHAAHTSAFGVALAVVALRAQESLPHRVPAPGLWRMPHGWIARSTPVSAAAFRFPGRRASRRLRQHFHRWCPPEVHFTSTKMLGRKASCLHAIWVGGLVSIRVCFVGALWVLSVGRSRRALAVLACVHRLGSKI
jgi:hypothetical protein